MSAEAALEFQEKAEEIEMTQFKSLEDLKTKTQWLGQRTGRMHIGNKLHLTYHLRDEAKGFSATTTLVIQQYLGGEILVLRANFQTLQNT